MMLKISTSNDNNNSGTNNSNSNKLLSWWQKKKLFSFQNKNKNKTRSMMTTQNWRNLSPDEPPLPFLVNKTIPSIKFSEVDNFGSELAPTLKDVEYIPSTSLYISQRPSSSSRELYTIPELSEMNTTVTTNNSSTISSSVTPPIANINIPNNTSSEAIDSSSSIHHHHTNTSFHTLVTTRDQQDVLCIVPPLPPQPSSSSSVQQLYNSNDDATSFTTTLHTTYNNNSEKLPPMILISDSDDDEEDNTENINDLYVPISDWPSLLGSCEPQFKSSLLGNEPECKLIFSHLMESAYKYHNEKKNNEPKEMRLVFNEEGNIRGVSIILQDGKREDYLEFGGSTQYIPPELSANSTYNDELADIWSLGVSLYRMLIGRYPFTHIDDNESDLKLFKRMLNSDFNIPTSRLSDDVEDLLLKMLAPENSRATFDIVLFHPWIKSHIHPDHLKREKTKEKKKKKKSVGKVLVKVLKKAIRLVFLGPYPPPKRHHYYYTASIRS